MKRLILLITLVFNITVHAQDSTLTYIELDYNIIPIGAIYEFDSLIYDSGRLYRGTSAPDRELNRVYEFLKKNESLIVEIRAHTDERGNDDFNEDLSQRRAQAVVDFLIDKGISPKRLIAKGYGEEMPYTIQTTDWMYRDICKPGTVLNKDFIYSLKSKEDIEACHQLNRRVEMVVIGKDIEDSLKIPFDKPIRIEGIMFDFDSWKIRPKSYSILDELVNFLQDNPTLVIEVANHTDCRGSDSYSIRLSQRRAESVVDYLIDHGIDPSRVVPKGYEEDQPYTYEGKLLTCDYIFSIEDKETQEMLHQMNRRTEFRVLSTDYIPPAPKRTHEAPFLLNE